MFRAARVSVFKVVGCTPGAAHDGRVLKLIPEEDLEIEAFRVLGRYGVSTKIYFAGRCHEQDCYGHLVRQWWSWTTDQATP